MGPPAGSLGCWHSAESLRYNLCFPLSESAWGMGRHVAPGSPAMKEGGNACETP
jgi:hypothetical protein